MDAQPAFGFKELFTHVVGDVAKALCHRNGEPEQRQYARSQAAVAMIMGFVPRDVIEAMLAGHCVMFHELIVDSVQHTILGELDAMRRGSRSCIVAMDKCFANNLERLAHYQLRPSTGHRDAAGVEVVAAEAGAREMSGSPDTAIHEELHAAEMRAAVEAADGQAEDAGIAGDAAASAGDAIVPELDPELDDAPATGALANDATHRPIMAELFVDTTTPVPAGTVVLRGSAATLAACRANPEAMAALEAGDPDGFARALGLPRPSEEFLAAAAAPGSPFQTDFQPTRESEPLPPPGSDSSQRINDRMRRSG